jgi:hypothetical protein
MREFQRAHNDDPQSIVEPWSPASFEDSPQLAKRRIVHFRSQIKAPAWVKKFLGACSCLLEALQACMHACMQLQVSDDQHAHAAMVLPSAVSCTAA